MGSNAPWSDESIRLLLTCKTFDELVTAFPGISLNTLRSARDRYKRSRPDLAKGSTEPRPTAVVVHKVPPEPDPNMIPRATHEKVLRELHMVKHKQADYLDTVWRAVAESIALVNIKPVPVPTQDKRTYGEEVAFALLSDMQCAKVTPDYNTEICRERVMRYARKIVALAAIQRKDHPVRVCHVGMLGDMVEGVDIFPGQQWLIDSTLYRQIFETTPTILVDFLRYLLGHFDRVVVWAVQGNHGRIGRKGVFGPEDNADRMLYRLVKMMLAGEPRIEFNMSDPAGERAWYLVAKIGEYRAMLIHGDQIRGANGYPWYGLGKKVHSWASGGIDETFDDICLGHYHQLGAMPLNKRVAWANGAVESTNTFAAETMAAQSDPKQWLLFVHPEKGRVTAAYPVYLLDEKPKGKRK